MKMRINALSNGLMHRLYREFKESLKDIAVEEAVDLYFFRPITFVFVKLIYRLPVTPNQLSVMSIVFGITSGVFYAFGDRRSFIYGALFYILSHIFDCSDGMVARLKKNGTAIGRIIDGWADYITSVAVYIGFLVGLFNGTFDIPVNPWLLMIPASFSLAIHAGTADYHRREFMAHALGKVTSIRAELHEASELLEDLKQKKGKYITKLMLIFYIGYTKLQIKENPETKVKYDPDRYYRSNRLLLMLWNWIGAATHITVLVVAALFYNPMIFFYYILGVANVWMLILSFIQTRVKNKIAIRA